MEEGIVGFSWMQGPLIPSLQKLEEIFSRRLTLPKRWLQLAQHMLAVLLLHAKICGIITWTI